MATKKAEEPRVVPEHVRICTNCKLPFNQKAEPHCRCIIWEVGKMPKKD